MGVPIYETLIDRVVIITGGSRGFGWFIAKKLLQEGAKVILTAARSREELDHVHKEAEDMVGPGRCITTQADVRKWEDCERTVERALETFGKVDVLINNAGRGPGEFWPKNSQDPIPFWSIPVDGWRSIIDTNMTGVFQMTKAAISPMSERKFGKIFSVSTSLVTMVRTGISAYGASKAGLETAHIGWARDAKELGIDINILLPGGPSDTVFVTRDMVPGVVGERVGQDSALLPGDVIVPAAVYMCTDATNGLSGRRVIAKFWDSTIDPASAFEKCLQPQHEHPEIM